MLDIDKDKDFSLINIFGKQKFEKWIKSYSILKNKDVLSWIRDKIDKYTDEGKKAQKFTITAYLNALQQYCNYYEVNNPSELLQEVDIDKRNFRVKKYLQYLLKYDKKDISELKELGFRKIPTSVTIRNNIQAKIKSFYSNRGLPISYNLKSAKAGANKNEITLTKDIIKKIQSKLESPNYILICKFETQTGLRISDVIAELTSGKYIIEKYQEHYFVRNFVSQKETVTINFLFFTKELTEKIQSVNAIDDLTKLDLTKLFLARKSPKTKRDNNGKALRDKNDKIIYELDDNGNKIYEKNRVNINDYLSRLKAIIIDLKINGNIKTHGLRKYYNSQLAKNRKLLDDDRILTHWEGREAPYTDQIYSRHIKDIDFYYTEWKKMETFICIDCTIYDNTNIEISNLKAQYDDMIKQNIEKDKEIAELKGLKEKMLIMDKNFDKILKVLDIKENEINDMSKQVSEIKELLKKKQ